MTMLVTKNLTNNKKKIKTPMPKIKKTMIKKMKIKTKRKARMMRKTRKSETTTKNILTPTKKSKPMHP